MPTPPGGRRDRGRSAPRGGRGCDRQDRRRGVAHDGHGPCACTRDDPARTAGGSSTGEAVVVARGRVAAGHRQRLRRQHPATRGVVRRVRLQAERRPRADDRSLPPGRRAERRAHADRAAGAETSRLIARVLPIIAGPDGHDPGVHAGADSVDEHDRPSRGARFAVLVERRRVDDCAGARCSRRSRRGDCVARRDSTRVEWTMPWLVPALDITRAATGAARGALARDAEQQLWDWDRFRRRYLRAFAGHRLPAHAGDTRDRRRCSVDLDGEDFVFTLPASLTGSPAVSIPAGRGRRRAADSRCS